MSSIRGRDGRVFTVGDRCEFRHVPLEGLNDGWDWRAPDDLRLWDTEVECEVWDGQRWKPIHPLAVYPRSGMVSFSRCLRGLHVRASGWCFTTAFLCVIDRWVVNIEHIVRDASVIGVGTVVTKTRQQGVTASLSRSVDSPGRVYVWFPHGNCVLTGVGVLTPDGETVVFDHEGVTYEPC